jgi:hypothetical protein
VDKAPEGAFPVSVLLEWKKQHERVVEAALTARTFTDMRELCNEISRLLVENHQVWRDFGPESEEARANPMSTASVTWTLRKLDVIVPNNRKIINIIKANKMMFSLQEYRVACQFIEHAEAFELNCYDRKEGAPRFPSAFQKIVEEGSNE